MSGYAHVRPSDVPDVIETRVIGTTEIRNIKRGCFELFFHKQPFDHYPEEAILSTQ